MFFHGWCCLLQLALVTLFHSQQFTLQKGLMVRWPYDLHQVLDQLWAQDFGRGRDSLKHQSVWTPTQRMYLWNMSYQLPSPKTCFGLLLIYLLTCCSCQEYFNLVLKPVNLKLSKHHIQFCFILWVTTTKHIKNSFFFFLSVLGFELRALHLPGRCATISVIYSALKNFQNLKKETIKQGVVAHAHHPSTEVEDHEFKPGIQG
jgi:hypothetical protein